MEEKNTQQQEEYELIRETIKTRPINRKKLFRRTVITAAMAVIFGVLACITFLVLEPVFSNLLSPKDEQPVAEVVKIPLQEDEILPQDMILQEETPSPSPVIIKEVGDNSSSIERYSHLYTELYNISRDTRRSTVTVTGISEDIDWFNNTYENKGQTTGLIVANNGIEQLILTDYETIRDAQSIKVTYFNDLTVEALVKGTDSNTGLAVIAVKNYMLPSVLLDEKLIAKLGSSRSGSLLGIPVIAIGRPLGNIDSIEYGMITSKGNMLNLVDNNYELMTTDLHGNKDSTGVIYNLSAEVIGIIYQKGPADSSIISVLGISDIKKTIERMSNAAPKAYLGVIGTEVTAYAASQGIPQGAYVTGVDIDSPAMKAGIQSGDVITKVDNIEISTYSIFTEAIAIHEPEEEASITVRRMGVDGYKDVTITVVLGELR